MFLLGKLKILRENEKSCQVRGFCKRQLGSLTLTVCYHATRTQLAIFQSVHVVLLHDGCQELREQLGRRRLLIVGVLAETQTFVFVAGRGDDGAHQVAVGLVQVCTLRTIRRYVMSVANAIGSEWRFVASIYRSPELFSQSN